jgi:hypothetical protein
MNAHPHCVNIKLSKALRCPLICVMSLHRQELHNVNAPAIVRHFVWVRARELVLCLGNAPHTT